MVRKNKLVLMLLGLMTLSLILSGCRQAKPTLYVYNWGDYIDEDILDEFEKETGMKIVYDTFATNEDMYVKIKSGGSTYDIIFPSDYMLTRMREEGMLEKIDLNKIPNHKNIESRFMNTDYDLGNEYSLPYMWGTMGILYNTTMVDEEVTSWEILWDPKYSKNILMLDSQRDSIGAALLLLGHDLNTLDPNELAEAGQLLKEQKPVVLAYVVDEGKDKMVAGEAALALVWSGEAAFARNENSDLAYAIPREGTNIWYDAMAIPKGAKNADGAHKFMDFLNRADIAFRNADYTGYATPNGPARAMLDPDISNDRAIYPEEEDLINAQVFVNLGQTLKDYDRIWTEVKAH